MMVTRVLIGVTPTVVEAEVFCETDRVYRIFWGAMKLSWPSSTDIHPEHDEMPTRRLRGAGLDNEWSLALVKEALQKDKRALLILDALVTDCEGAIKRIQRFLRDDHPWNLCPVAHHLEPATIKNLTEFLEGWKAQLPPTIWERLLLDA